MGINEKRILEQYKKTFETKELGPLKSIGGLKLDVEVVWDDLYNQIDDSTLEDFEAYINEVFLTPIKDSLTSICADDLGKGLIGKVLKKIKICCTADIDQNPKAFVFKAGTLTADHSRRKTGSDFTAERTLYLTTMLEDML